MINISDNIELKKFVYSLVTTRPAADHSVEQYLMSMDSYLTQLSLLSSVFLTSGSVYMVGDDDHFSPTFSKYLNLKPHVVELDQRIIDSIKLFSEKNEINNIIIEQTDVAEKYEELVASEKEKYDYFYINPPYNSKNEAYGIKVWLSIVLSKIKVGGIGVLVLPITASLDWSIKNLFLVEKFLTQNNCVIVDIHKNKHFYEDVPDVGLCSSNIIINKIGNSEEIIPKIERNIYR